MKVLFVALGVYSKGGGMEQFNQRVVRCLAEIGSSVELTSRVLALWDTAGCALQAPARVRFVPGGGSKVRTAAAFAWHVWNMQADVILYGHILLLPLVCLARLLSPGSRQVLFVHGRDVWAEPFRARVPLLERLSTRYLVDRVISVSRFTALRMESAYRLPRGIFRILPNAVDPAPLRAAGESKQSLPASAPRILSVARLDNGARHKGCDKVIRILSTLLSEFPGLQYEIVGRGSLGRELTALAEELGVGDHVRISGYLGAAELEKAYQSAQVFVLPSTGEGFGIVFLEAWKHRLPVVAGNKDASTEVVTHSHNGVCIDPDSPEELAQAILGLLRHPEQAERMGRAGYQSVLERHTHTHFRQRLWEILREDWPGVSRNTDQT